MRSVTPEMFEQWMREISNWGRWGKDDELGTLNLITPLKRRNAAALVRDGVAVSLALDLNKVRDDLNANPFEHTLTVSEFGGHEVAGDRYIQRRRQDRPGMEVQSVLHLPARRCELHRG